MKTFAFISYAREDKAIALWLQQKLEKYHYPASWVAPENKPEDPKFLRKVFIDLEDLPVEKGQYRDHLHRRLEEARYLILICSEHSVKSDAVDDEIKHFLATHDNNTDLILPVFIDKVRAHVPPALKDYDILKRNCPRFDSTVSLKSKTNLFHFYHIVAFLLKTDFSKLYDRYERYARRKRRLAMTWYGIFMALLALTVTFLCASLHHQKKALEHEMELTNFEKSIFPLSIVFGYHSNFLDPLVEYVKEYNAETEVYILMPYSMSDLNHGKRIAKMEERLKKELNLTDLKKEILNTRMKRGTNIGVLFSEDDRYRNVYVDFASTTSTFYQIIDYKKEAYPDLDDDALLKFYSETFIRQTIEQLGENAKYVHFFTSPDEFISAIKKKGEQTRAAGN